MDAAPARPQAGGTKARSPWLRAGRAGTSTRRSTTGRTRGRSAAATSPFWRGVALRARGPRARARVRHRPHLAAAGARRRAARRHRSLGADARRARPSGVAPGAASGVGAPRRRVRSCAATSAHLPFARGATFGLVMAPYGILQSLLRERDLTATLAAVARVLQPRRAVRHRSRRRRAGWREYARPGQPERGRRGRRAPHARRIGPPGPQARRLTIFEQELRRTPRPASDRSIGSTLTFRTLPVPQMARRLERAGFAVQAVLGDYAGGPWDDRADGVGCILARRPARRECQKRFHHSDLVDLARSFRHVRPFQVAHHQAQEGRRSTPSAARSSRASSRN